MFNFNNLKNMKNIKLINYLCIFAIVVICNNYSNAQTSYKRVLTDNKVWVYEYGSYNPLETEFYSAKYTAKVVGDTLCDNMSAKKLSVCLESLDTTDPENPIKEQKTSIKVLFEENGIIWDEDGCKYFDLNQEVGEDYYPKMQMGNIYDDMTIFTVEYIDECESMIGPLKRIGYHDIGNNAFAMVEGIGTSINHLFNLHPHYRFVKMTVCYDNGIPIFYEKDFFRNQNGVRDLEYEHAGNSNSYDPSKPAFNLMGNKIFNPSPGSIIIQDGRKVVIR